jgi:pyridoxamine 5'-phosphate oxidase
MSFVDPRSRQSRRDRPLLEAELHTDPLVQFHAWFAEAAEQGVVQPEAMTLATVDSNTGQPSARIVLLRHLDARGFVFFTNYDSRKGRELTGNPRAALVFFWEPLERQVRIEGQVEKVSASESDAYFRSRPRGSQLGAWASEQSTELASREALDTLFRELETKFAASREIPRPPHWGGFRVIPTRIEFWQGQPSRLHDRISYRKTDDGHWIRARLAP